MRATITIPDDLLQKTMQASGKTGYSDAIVTSIKEYLAMKARLQFLENLYHHKLPHSFEKIKRQRKQGTWSAQ